MTDQALVLLVDDHPENLDILVNYLANTGLELMVATDGEQALQLVEQRTPDLVLLDIMMPGMDGFEVCRRLKAREATRDAVVIFLSALTDTKDKVKGFTVGAIDFINKPLQREEVWARIQAHLTIRRQQRLLTEKNRQLESLNRELQEQIDRRIQAEDALHIADEKLSALSRQEAERWGLEAFIGQSKAIKRLIPEVQSLQQAPSTNVLVLGESGTGKELVSRAIHFGSSRNGQPFIAVNCSAIPTELADAEFFGHVKGAYTGANNDRHGYFVQADGGTLFLDEIGDMPLALQAKLLRVLEDGLVTPIGGKSNRKVNVRVVAATNVNLQQQIQKKLFRQDLYYRLAGYQICLPPLRERTGDIAPLADHFLQLLGRQMGRENPSISSSAIDALCRYHYPGNVRELRNLIEYALIASRGKTIDKHHLRFPEEFASFENANFAVPSDLPRDAAETASPANASFDSSLLSDEEAILAYVESEGRIDNTSAQSHLNINHARASYLLKKLHKEGQLVKQGQRRWTWYVLP